MKLAFLSLNYAPEQIGIGPYSCMTAEMLAAAGHEVSVICGKPYYPEWRIAESYRPGFYTTRREAGVRVTRCPHYVPARPGGVKRLLHHFTFALSAFCALLYQTARQRPDVILATAPSLIAALGGRVVAGLCGARFWLHVQDFELEAAQAAGVLSKGFPGNRLVGMAESHFFRSADIVSSISPQMCQRLADKGVAQERIVEFPNWAEDDTIRPLSRNTDLRREWSLGDRTVVLYSGNIGRKQGLNIVLEAARDLQHRQDLIFVICGEGPERTELERQAVGLDHCLIKPLQSRERLGELLATADIFILPQLADAADLVLPSKLPNMMAAGRPVIATTEPGTGVYDEIRNVGIATRPGDPVALARAIERLADNPALREDLGYRARWKAISRWARDGILKRFLCDFTRVANIPRSSRRKGRGAIVSLIFLTIGLTGFFSRLAWLLLAGNF
ncbi:colanic acid biosynthesis glycosyltransferase WcaI [Altericroceibacterium spongiae]|uniref:Colanic acid biosynthesis glycosyltransferase WcaI n=1 Tax=Altericroceibacterium spongiae TaxID=2320269 RepID=A0A420EIX0_9SPHN|nr:WcaI family glycosyltransferase [Altericroceibacterium spongiae]RKF20659.1 colanic acid biosynthesis glycosyltransferase WcaI [Altericroceibacterium spongiae]